MANFRRELSIRAPSSHDQSDLSVVQSEVDMLNRNYLSLISELNQRLMHAKVRYEQAGVALPVASFSYHEQAGVRLCPLPVASFSYHEQAGVTLPVASFSYHEQAGVTLPVASLFHQLPCLAIEVH